MIFFDTNMLIYFSINQIEDRQKRSMEIVEKAIAEDRFFISPLVFSEFIFVLSKIKMLDVSEERVKYFSKYIQGSIDKKLVKESYLLCEEIKFCKNINDVIHLKTAEKYCSKIITFDSDFKNLQKFTNLEIEIL
ncbi:MAG: type II toxin-antitoxin system VapC family toxin [Campylobacterales bacterium]|nr:type II toxin-antitoxin system VapC family toxin [Campylobacterales bacterium]